MTSRNKNKRKQKIFALKLNDKQLEEKKLFPKIIQTFQRIVGIQNIDGATIMLNEMLNKNDYIPLNKIIKFMNNLEKDSDKLKILFNYDYKGSKNIYEDERQFNAFNSYILQWLNAEIRENVWVHNKKEKIEVSFSETEDILKLGLEYFYEDEFRELNCFFYYLRIAELKILFNKNKNLKKLKSENKLKSSDYLTYRYLPKKANEQLLNIELPFIEDENGNVESDPFKYYTELQKFIDNNLTDNIYEQEDKKTLNVQMLFQSDKNNYMEIINSIDGSDINDQDLISSLRNNK